MFVLLFDESCHKLTEILKFAQVTSKLSYFCAKSGFMLNVAIVAGGDSGEYNISVKSGKQVELFIDRDIFRPYLIIIRGNQWYCRAGFKKFPVNKGDFSLTNGLQKIRFDVVFNAIHGTPGENGRLQGYFDLLGIPYTSSGVTTAALTFNKAYCKDVVAAAGILTARSVHMIGGYEGMEKEIIDRLKFPLFVKPNNGGSSVGMSKVGDPAELPEALDLALKEDREILVEEFVKGRELTCGVLQVNGEVTALPVTEIIPRKEYFDFEAKYKKGMSEEVVPAAIPEDVSEKCRAISKRLYRKLNCRGVVRFDYIFDGSEFYFLEVNTVPGLTAASIVPKMARAHGWTFTELITLLIQESLV